jgi:hypothetical protein
MQSRPQPTDRTRPSWSRTRCIALAGVALLILGQLLPEGASAHARSLSYSSWDVSEQIVRVRVRITLLELSRLPLALPASGSGPRTLAGGTGADEVGAYLQAHLSLTAEDSRCEPISAPALRRADDGWVAYEWSLQCQAAGTRTISTRILLDEAPSHLHFARVTLADALVDEAGVAGAQDGQAPILERVLSEAQASWTIALRTGPDGSGATLEASGTPLAEYLLLGIEHILTGWDHLAFVLALVLLAGRLAEVAKLVTGFTLAHSLTLALAVLGLVHPEAAAVEAVIGFSVALLAAENAWLLAAKSAWVPAIATGGLVVLAGLAAMGIGQVSLLTMIGLAVFTACHFALLARTRRETLLRIALAFAFGLVHGFGFAGVLAEMALPTHRLAPALIGFNLGVEIGQLAVVALIWPPLSLLMRAGQGERQGWLYWRTAELCSAAVCGIGVFWFLTRTYGA